MLVLSRKLGEQVIIGKQIVVTVLAVRGGRVKLGFLGPGQVPIPRRKSVGSPPRRTIRSDARIWPVLHHARILPHVLRLFGLSVVRQS